jgi:hypothetical protein
MPPPPLSGVFLLLGKQELSVWEKEREFPPNYCSLIAIKSREGAGGFFFHRSKQFHQQGLSSKPINFATQYLAETKILRIKDVGKIKSNRKSIAAVQD